MSGHRVDLGIRSGISVLMFFFIRKVISPEAQIAIAVLVVLSSAIILLLALLRFVPTLDQYAIAKEEPLWVLLLSIAALLYAGLSALPAALAYREASKLTPDEE